jgi:hypothetical protein
MNRITRRLRELSTGMVKERRLSLYPYDVKLKLKPGTFLINKKTGKYDIRQTPKNLRKLGVF